MKFLVDECVGPRAALWLTQQGFDVVSVFGAMIGTQDFVLLNQAFKEGRVLITGDKDYGDLVFRDKKQHCGILLLRLIDERPDNKIRAIQRALTNHKHELEGNFVVVTESAVRVIHLIDA